MHAWLRRFAGFALLVAGCAPFKAGTGADASTDDTGAQMGDMQVRADMDVDASTSPFDAAIDATLADASIAIPDASVDMEAPLETQCVPELPLTNVIAESSGEMRCCKIQLGVGAAASPYIYAREDAPFPSSLDPASDASEYVRLALHGRNRCYGISMVTDAHFATTVHYTVPPDARIATATTASGSAMECVSGTAPVPPADDVGFPVLAISSCPISAPDCATESVQWVSTTTPFCSTPPCLAAGSTWLVVGWLESSALRACLGSGSPDFGLDSEDACPLEGDPIDEINAVPDCP